MAAINEPKVRLLIVLPLDILGVYEMNGKTARVKDCLSFDTGRPG